jgi:hypothetical protein
MIMITYTVSPRFLKFTPAVETTMTLSTQAALALLDLQQAVCIPALLTTKDKWMTSRRNAINFLVRMQL